MAEERDESPKVVEPLEDDEEDAPGLCVPMAIRRDRRGV